MSIRTLREQVASQFTQQRLIARLTSFFGVLSLVLASIGLYGVTAYNAGRRTNEIGVRMALGASRGHVVRLVLRGAFGLILVGLLIGLPLTFAVGRFLGNQLYGTSPYNPAVTLVAVRGARVLGAGRVVRPRPSSEHDFAVGRAAGRVAALVESPSFLYPNALTFELIQAAGSVNPSQRCGRVIDPGGGSWYDPSSQPGQRKTACLV